MALDPHPDAPKSPDETTSAFVETGTFRSADGTGGPSDMGLMPTFEAPARPRRRRDHAEALAELAPGRRLGQFELVRELGAGAFGRVFLARHIPLDRLVALKVTACQGGEARTLARLEHDHIVRVFSEEVDPDTGLRLVSMQYVPGTTLATVGALPPASRTGRAILQAVATQPADPATPDPVSRREADHLAGCDPIEAVCWLGARLAEALDHAHCQGVLHRDVKPSNILMHANGRVLLTDFNLATHPQPGDGQTFGGTPAYMAPEHLDAFNPVNPMSPEAVDVRSDIYSLGVVLFELLTGRRPFAAPATGFSAEESLRTMAAERRREAPSPRRTCPDVPPALDLVVRRCLAPDPQQRYQTATELARVLEGCRELYGLNRPAAAGPLTRFARRRPILTAAVLPLLPHVVGALLVIGYTLVWLASHPARPLLEGLFARVAVAYIAIVFPITGTISYLLTRSIWGTCRRLQLGEAISPDEVIRVRQRALNKPFWGLLLSAAGWLPGALVLPPLVKVLAPQAAEFDVLLQWFLSFAIAGLIAMTYTEFADLFLLLNVAYPSLWVDPVRPRQTAAAELRHIERRLRVAQVLTVLVPLTTGIALMAGLVSAGPEQRASSGFQVFLLLVAGLMGLGLAGSWVAVVISGRLNRTVAALTGAGENTSPR